LRAAQETEDALVALDSAIQQDALIGETVTSARRSTEVAQLRFNEGLADYQRVLDAHQALFSQQTRYVGNQSKVVSSFIALYLALGGGWETHTDADMIDTETRDALMERTDWGDLIE
jgi:multidrug efflux system outer membrane protein